MTILNNGAESSLISEKYYMTNKHHKKFCILQIISSTYWTQPYLYHWSSVVFVAAFLKKMPECHLEQTFVKIFFYLTKLPKMADNLFSKWGSNKWLCCCCLSFFFLNSIKLKHPLDNFYAVWSEDLGNVSQPGDGNSRGGLKMTYYKIRQNKL